ncbi:MAG: putative metal-binding motif-containing protein [Alphaproteobacteria bacterium]|nr:putative metal-binding motif-containing protein [Alphaproteobacteria bacterium]MCB9697730.1 putative metal-binding motif-containing protein [Alphaproteobacteria bacterium]
MDAVRSAGFAVERRDDGEGRRILPHGGRCRRLPVGEEEGRRTSHHAFRDAEVLHLHGNRRYDRRQCSRPANEGAPRSGRFGPSPKIVVELGDERIGRTIPAAPCLHTLPPTRARRRRPVIGLLLAGCVRPPPTAVSTSTDEDGDGFGPLENDCDDADPSRHPGAEEVVGDGIDQDCDGSDQRTTSLAEVARWRMVGDGEYDSFGTSVACSPSRVGELRSAVAIGGDEGGTSTSTVTPTVSWSSPPRPPIVPTPTRARCSCSTRWRANASCPSRPRSGSKAPGSRTPTAPCRWETWTTTAPPSCWSVRRTWTGRLPGGSSCIEARTLVVTPPPTRPG